MVSPLGLDELFPSISQKTIENIRKCNQEQYKAKSTECEENHTEDGVAGVKN